MKTKLLIVTIATFIATQTVFAQTEKQVAAIRNEVNLINRNAKSYKKTKKDVEGISLEGTEATYFVSGRGLHKITARIYGESYRATTALYYQGEELIFAYEQFSHYDTQIGMTPPPKVVSVKETRFYFVGGKMIKLLVGKIRVKKTAKEWVDSESEMTETARKLKEAF